MPVTLLNREQMREMTGTDRISAPCWTSRGGDLHPLSYARGLARAAMAAGAAVDGETPALSLSREGAHWRIETPRGIVRAEKVLLATNGFTGDLGRACAAVSCRCSLRSRPARLCPKRLRARSCRRVPVLYESGHITVYYRIDAA